MGAGGWRFRCNRLHVVVVLACVAVVGTLLTFASYDAEAKRNPGLDTGDDATAQAAGASTDTTPVSADSVRAAARQRLNLPLTLPGHNSQPPAKAAAGDAGDASQADNDGAGTAGADSLSAETPTAAQDPAQWDSTTVRRGDSMAAIFSRLKLSPSDLHRIMALGKPTATLKHILPGQHIKVRTDDQHGLQELVYRIDKVHSLQVLRDTNGFQANHLARKPEVRVNRAAAVIDSSLFAAAQKAGLSQRLIMELANIFGWDVDFALDIREGDRFSVIYEEDYLDGKKLHDGDILAAEFTNKGHTYRAVRYTDPSGHTDYYSPDGHSMRKAFLRTPVAFTRISSRFGMRYHPILHRMRMHDGVDYAAPKGTPVKSTGDGKIIFRGRKGGYGHVVIIKHGGRYSTLYGHLWKFARGQHVGSHVRQGEIIGYVGMSGLATGPHLHYEFRVNGRHRNPLKVQLPAAAPIQAKYKNGYEAHAHELLAELKVYTRTQLASNQP